VKTVVIANPASDNGVTAKRWSQILSVLARKLTDFDYRLTEGPGHATELTRDALASGATMVVSVGGEGTNNEIVNGFLDSAGRVNGNAVLGLLPSGTACDFARMLGIPNHLDAAIDVLVQGRPRTCDLGKASFRDHDGQVVERFFLNVADLGIGGETVARMNRSTKALGHLMSYLYGFLVTLAKYRNKPIRLVVDESDLGETIVKGIVVSNGKCCGGGMQVAPHASVDDGLLDLLIIGNVSRRTVLRHLPALYAGKLTERHNVTRMRGRRILVTSDERVLIDLDGEQPGMLPASFEVVPGAIQINVPANTAW
jgi:YegS/Rv2252/BmrU family lipid kinase